MLKFLFVLILNLSFLIVNCFAQSWYVIDPTSISGTPDFSDLFFIDENTGWISSSSQVNIFKTVDGAGSFSTQVTQYATNAIHMINENEGYAGGASGRVYRTTDGGENWIAIGGIGQTLVDLDFVSSTQGYACGINGAVYSTTPAGVVNLNSGLGLTLNGISSPSVNNVWVCGGTRVYYYNGITFTEQPSPTGNFNALYFINNQEGWVVGTDGIIAHTTNGGTSWAVQTNDDTNSLFDVFFLTASEGWAVGVNGTILHTTNGGTNWTVEGAGLTTAFLRGVHFTSSTNGYVVGNGKTLIKYGMPLATEDENGLPTEFSLSQNYPNPFNPSTIIKYNISPTSSSPFEGGLRGMSVQLKIYNILGSEVATLVNEAQMPGEYEIKFIVGTDSKSVQPNGIYFYQLTVGNNVETKKMLLIK